MTDRQTQKLLLTVIVLAIPGLALWMLGTGDSQEEIVAPAPPAGIEPSPTKTATTPDAVEFSDAPVAAVRSEASTRERAAASPSNSEEPRNLSHWMRVLDRDDGTPIEGARAFYCPRDRRPPELISDSADDEGLLEARLTIQRLQRKFPYDVKIEAPGYWPQFVGIRDVVARRDAPDLHGLVRSASLDVRVVDEAGNPIPDVHLETRYAKPPYEESTHFSFATLPHRTDALTGADGFARLSPLPPEVEIQLETRALGGRAYRPADSIVLKPGEQAEFQWDLFLGVNLQGRLIDQHGRPVPNRELWLSPQIENESSERDRAYFRLNSRDARWRLTNVKTAEDGTFGFEAVPVGEWWLGPSPSHEPASDDVAPIALRVRVDPRQLTQVELQSPRGLFLGGRVVRPDGEVVQRALISADTTLGLVTANMYEGTFRLGPLASIPHALTARGWFQYQADDPGFGPSRPTSVRPDQRGLELVLTSGGLLRGQCFVAGSITPVGAAVLLHGDDPNFEEFRQVGEGGFVFRGLAAGTYELFAYTPEGRVGTLSSVRIEAGERLDGLDLVLDEGARLRVRYEGGPAEAEYRLSIGGRRLLRRPLRRSIMEEVAVLPGALRAELLVNGRARDLLEIYTTSGAETVVEFDLTE